MSLPLSDDFRSIVLQNRPLIDVRAPVEFEKGAFPNSFNAPLLNDEERRVIGIRYKEAGNDAAVTLGHELIRDQIKEERISAWQKLIQEHPQSYLYCFRGGQRSKISQQWLHDAGFPIVRLKGGYKAFRNFLMEESERISAVVPTQIIGGRTGSGKTILLQKIENSIDLEGLAHHRGSSFGRYIEPQPSQIAFENALAYALIQFEAKKYPKLVIEHESHNVGRVYIPKPVYDNFLKGELILLETPIEKRVQITFDEYVKDAIFQHRKHFKDLGDQEWADGILAALKRIKKRLGSQRYLTIVKLFNDAFDKQLQNDEIEDHKSWVKILLEEYYDPMYDYQIKKTILPIIFRGDEKEVLDFLKA